MSYPANQQQGQRWLPVFNTTNEAVPAYGCMMLATYRSDSNDKESTDTNRAQEGPDGLAYWKVAKPTRQVCDDQTAAVILFNGPIAIPPGGYGFGTQDYPCQALFGEGGSGNPGTSLSMAEGEWYLRGGPGPFAALTRDTSPHPAGDSSSGGDSSPVWITKDERQYWLGHIGGDRYGAEQADKSLGVQQPAAIWFGADDNNYAIEPIENGKAVQIRAGCGGVGIVSFSSTIWADASVPRGVVLSLALQVMSGTTSLRSGSGSVRNGHTNTSSGALSASRAHLVEYDTYPNREPFVAKENIACSGALYLPEGTVLRVVNNSSVTVQLLNLCFSVAMLTRDYRDDNYFSNATYDSDQVY